ncbi:hypothetical protein [Leekyejoonella antrihumi]|nr:hypothetical protein [Leekyejoonella antrihumi]
MSYLPVYVGPGHVVHKAPVGSASYRRTVQSMSSLGGECHATATH